MVEERKGWLVLLFPYSRSRERMGVVCRLWNLKAHFLVIDFLQWDSTYQVFYNLTKQCHGLGTNCSNMQAFSGRALHIQTTTPRMTLNFWSFYLEFVSAGLKVMHHHAQCVWYWRWNPGLCASSLPTASLDLTGCILQDNLVLMPLLI